MGNVVANRNFHVEWVCGLANNRWTNHWCKGEEAMKPKREYERLKKIMDRLRLKHPDWTDEQIENEATEILLGLKKE